jgi:hypothetical protein
MAERLFGQGVGLAELQTPALQPAPIQSSTFVRPQQKQVGQNAAALANALGGLNNGLLAYGRAAAVQDQRLQDPNSDANKDFENSLYGKNVDELTAMAKEGNLPRVQADALSSILGFRVSDQFQTDTSSWAATEFDQSKGDLSAQLEERRQAVMRNLPNDAARAAFFKATQGYASRLVASDTDRRVNEAVGARNDGILAQYRTIVTEGLHADMDPAAIAAEVTKAGAANRAFAALDGPSQNAIVFSLAQEFAQQGRPELVKALLEDPRGGVGPLGQTAEYATKGLSLIEAATNVRDRKAGEDNLDLYMSVDKQVAEGTFTDKTAAALKAQHPELTPAWLASRVDQSANNRQQAALRAQRETEKRTARLVSEQQRNAALSNAMLQSRGLNGWQKIDDVEIPSPTGEGTVKVSKKEQQDFVVNQVLTQLNGSKGERLRQGMSEAEADKSIFDDKLRWFAGSNAINPEWDVTLNSTPVIASPALLADPKNPIPPELINGAELYRQLYAANPAYAAKLVHGNIAEDFYEAYRFERENGGSVTNQSGNVPERAIRNAASAAAMTPTAKSSLGITDKAIDEKIGQVSPKTWGEFFTLADGWEPNADDKGKLKDLVKGYMTAQRMPFDKALEHAVARMKATSTVVNGYLVQSNDRNFPADFKEITEALLDEYAQAHPDENLDGGKDLYVVPIGPEKWAIARKEGGFTSGMITQKSLQDYRKVRADEALRSEADWEKLKDERGYIRALATWGSLNQPRMTTEEAQAFLSNKRRTRDIERFINADAAKRGYVFASLKDGSMAWVNPATKEIMDFKTLWSDDDKSVTWAGTGMQYNKAVITKADGGFAIRYLAKPKQ